LKRLDLSNSVCDCEACTQIGALQINVFHVSTTCMHFTKDSWSKYKYNQKPTPIRSDQSRSNYMIITTSIVVVLLFVFSSTTSG